MKNETVKGIHFLARAKINLSLAVLGTRPDGYHEIESIMQSIDLADDLRIWCPEGQGEDGPPVRLVCNDPRIPANEENLAWKAAALIQKEAGLKQGVEIRLRKEIPAAAGLAGGSADAAAVLAGMNQLFGLGLKLEELTKLAFRLGADVGFCLRGGTVLVQGFGERMTPLPDLPGMWLVLVKPAFGLSTRDVYRAYDDLIFQTEVGTARTHADTVAVLDGVMRRSPAHLAAHMANDLESVAFKLQPRLQEFKDRMEAAGAAKVYMSGSGPTLLAMADSQEAAEEMAAVLRLELTDVEMVRAVKTVPRGLEILKFD